MTAKSFKNRVEALLRKTHPTATVGIVWTHCAKVRWADGTTGYSGVLTATAPGFRTRSMVASFSHGELSVR